MTRKPTVAPPDNAAPFSELGAPCKVQTLHPTQIPGSGAAQSVFSTSPRKVGSMTDYGGFQLGLTYWGVMVSNDVGRMLVPWSQVMSLEFAPLR